MKPVIVPTLLNLFIKQKGNEHQMGVTCLVTKRTDFDICLGKHFYPGGESGLMIKNLSITLGMLTNKTAVVVVAQQKRK